MANLSLKDIKKTYGKDVHILKGIDLEVSDGEFLVLVGPSGCGKSTLLRMIAGLEDITAGELSIDGRVVNNVQPKERDVAMVFQSYALYPHMTVRQNMGFSLSIQKRPKAEIEEKVNEAADMLGLTDLLDRLPKQLSGGQRQRVAIGRAIVRRPKVFLFDEPLSNLDANLRGQMRVELKKLHAKLKTTMIYVTHDQIEAMTLADRICVLEGGWAPQIDTPMNLYNYPNCKFVAEFIGSPPMNFLEAEYKKDEGFIANDLFIKASESIFSDETPQKILVGIRPHEFSTTENDGYVDAKVEVIETVGWDYHLHILVGKTKMIVQLEAKDAKDITEGQKLRLYIDPKGIKLFDSILGNSINNPEI